MLAAVAPFALEKGLLRSEPSGHPATHNITIHSLNTGAVYEAHVPIMVGSGQPFVQYSGECKIPGIPGAAAPLQVASLGVAGSQTGKLLPTGNASDIFSAGKRLGSVAVTLVDFARALVVLHADDVLPTFGYTSLNELTISQVQHDAALCEDLEDLRLQAGLAMGMGDCAGHDAPKLAVVGSAEGGVGEPGGGSFACRYLVQPGRREMHPTIAMTAAQALGAACLVEGGVARRALGRTPAPDVEVDEVFTFAIQHAKGTFPVSIGTQPASTDGFGHFALGVPHAGRYTTTVMPIAEGTAFIQN